MHGCPAQMGLTGGHRHLGVFRNRDNDQQASVWVAPRVG